MFLAHRIFPKELFHEFPNLYEDLEAYQPLYAIFILLAILKFHYSIVDFLKLTSKQ